MELHIVENVEASRIYEVDREIFKRISVRGHQAYLNEELGEVLEATPELARREVGELGDRLREEGHLTQTDANKALATLAIVARRRGDEQTITSLKHHFLGHFNLIGAGLVYFEERKLDKSTKQ